MMVKDELKKYFEILELTPDASLRDVHNSYMRLKSLYGTDSIALAPLNEEFPGNKRGALLAQIEEAYAKLLASKRGKPAHPHPGVPDSEKARASEGIGQASYGGPELREIREASGIGLDDISKELKLRIELLKGMEEEKFEALPEEIYLRVHLKNYAAFLKLNPEKVVEDYIRRYRAWKSKASPAEK
jgi:curved DNA-binding protein CbpA